MLANIDFADARPPLFPDGLRMRALEVSSRFSAPSSDPNHAEVSSACVWVKTAHQALFDIVGVAYRRYTNPPSLTSGFFISPIGEATPTEVSSE